MHKVETIVSLQKRKPKRDHKFDPKQKNPLNAKSRDNSKSPESIPNIVKQKTSPVNEVKRSIAFGKAVVIKISSADSVDSNSKGIRKSLTTLNRQ